MAEANKNLKEVYAQAERLYIDQQSLLIVEHWTHKRYDLAYKVMNSLCGRSRTFSVRIKGDTPAARMDSWFKHFSAVFKQTVHTTGELSLPYVMEEGIIFTECDFSVEELVASMQSSQNGRACGEDGIPAELLKTPGLAAYIIGLINQAYNSGTVPTRWKTLINVPVPKKGDLTIPKNYRGISLIDLLAKGYNRMLLTRLRSALDRYLLQCQEGFRPGRSTTHHIVLVRELLRYVKSNKDLSLVFTFVDFNKAFDSISWDYLRAILIAYRVPLKIVNAIMSMYDGANAKIRTSDGLTAAIPLGQGVLQGDTLAPYLFIIVMDWITRKAGLGSVHRGLCLMGHAPSRYNLRSRGNPAAPRLQQLEVPFTSFADDGSLIDGGALPLDTTIAAAQASLSSFEESGAVTGLSINDTKTVALACSAGKILSADIKILRLLSGADILTVRDFRYLGSLIAKELSDLAARLAAGWSHIQQAVKLWKSATLPLSTKMTFFKVLAVTVFLYGCESWILTEEVSDRLNGAYTRMLRFAKGLNFADHPTIAEIYGDMPSIITSVIQRRLDFLGRVLRARVTRPTLLVELLNFLVQQYREVVQSAVAPQNNGFAYIQQLYEDLDIGTGRPFKRNDFSAITTLADNVIAWDSMIKKRVEQVNAPAPIRPRARARKPLRTPAQPSQNMRRHAGRSPIRNTQAIRTFCRKLLLSPEDQELRDSARAQLTTDF